LNSHVKCDKCQVLRRLFGEAAKAVAGVAALVLALALFACAGSVAARSPEIETAGVVRLTDLPAEARETLALIKHGGPFPYSRDGEVFANREGRLPPAPRGTYREYTVKTPGSRDRGARRIIAAAGNQFWYTADHYRSFRRIAE
jgi:ribonuclease T1